MPAIEFAQRTHPGRDPTKQVNEDACDEQPTPLGHLAVLCDGMGGHEHGREASIMALEIIFGVFGNAPPDADRREVLRTAIMQANKAVRGIGEPGSHARPGSTVVAVLLHAGGAEVAHVGDSRCYLVHEGKLTQVTRDHSMVQQMVDAGFITADEAANHPDANKISRALGMKAEVEVEVRAEPILYVSGDAFILCSDGLSDMVSDAELLHTVTSAPALQAVGQLIDLANAHGGHDNITVQVMRARESCAQQPSNVAPTVIDTSPGVPHHSAPVPAPARSSPSVQGAAAQSRKGATQPVQAVQAAPPSKRRATPAPGRAASGPHSDPPPSEDTASGSSRSSVTRTVAIVLGALGLVAAGAAIYIELEHPASPVRTTPSFAASSVHDPVPPPTPTPQPEPTSALPSIPVESLSAVPDAVDASLPPHVPTPSGHPHHRPPAPAPSQPPGDDSH